MISAIIGYSKSLTGPSLTCAKISVGTYGAFLLSEPVDTSWCLQWGHADTVEI